MASNWLYYQRLLPVARPIEGFWVGLGKMGRERMVRHQAGEQGKS